MSKGSRDFTIQDWHFFFEAVPYNAVKTGMNSLRCPGWPWTHHDSTSASRVWDYQQAWLHLATLVSFNAIINFKDDR